jgi:hypothetical protein
LSGVPPELPKPKTSSLTIKLMTEGVPSNLAAKFDPTFHKPEITPTFMTSDRYKKIKSGELLDEEMDRAQAILDKIERDYDEKNNKLTPTSKREETPLLPPILNLEAIDPNMEAILSKMAKLTERADAFEAQFDKQWQESVKKNEKIAERLQIVSGNLGVKTPNRLSRQLSRQLSGTGSRMGSSILVKDSNNNSVEELVQDDKDEMEDDIVGEMEPTDKQSRVKNIIGSLFVDPLDDVKLICI